jgi:hypothetical protein
VDVAPALVASAVGVCERTLHSSRQRVVHVIQSMVLICYDGCAKVEMLI